MVGGGGFLSCGSQWWVVVSAAAIAEAAVATAAAAAAGLTEPLQQQQQQQQPSASPSPSALVGLRPVPGGLLKPVSMLLRTRFGGMLNEHCRLRVRMHTDAHCILEHCVRSGGSAIRRYCVLGCVAIVSALVVQRFLALVVHRLLRLCVVFVV